MARVSLSMVDNKNILTSTGGFLATGYTHTINMTLGCSHAESFCGDYCYAQHNFHVTKGRSWELYGYKANIEGAYAKEYDRLKNPRRGDPKPLRIYMSSSSDPYAPQEKRLRHTRSLLEAMLRRPPDVLVIQTHATLIVRDADIIEELSRLSELWVSLTVETDMERIPGLRNHPSSPAKRIETLTRFRRNGVRTQATVSPLCPLNEPVIFAGRLATACDRVILDHYLLGDGSAGLRTKRTSFPQKLQDAGFGEWNSLDKFWQIKAIFDRALGADRVLVSCDGFNAVGGFGVKTELL